MKSKSLSFDQYYQDIYPDWDQLKKNMLKEHGYYALDFTTVSSNKLSVLTEKIEATDSYFLDPVSTKTVDILDAQVDEVVYDLCSAPGGKSLYWCYQNFDQLAKLNLTVNEISKNRFIKLKKNLNQFLPQVENIRFTNFDARLWFQHETEVADKILLDVPCSSERHLLKQGSTDTWSFKKMKNLANTQFSLLCSALEVLKIGGELVYSTCSINPLENENILQRLEKKRTGRFELLQSELILPQVENHFGGPIFLAKIKRLS
ncbi:hypothetical protein N9N67_05000 [Bacteriovoracaceae bacterium]|nr:hypothetical protein [Bacteriovoracaceae bacterium]